MSDRSDHPVWGVYDEHRTARLNAKYFGTKLERTRRLNSGFEFVSAAASTGSAVAGWALWQSATGRAVWAVIAATAAVASILKPILRLPERLRLLQEILGGWRTLDHDLHEIGLLIRQKGAFGEELQRRFEAALERKGDLAARDPDGETDKDLLHACMAQAIAELPVERLYVPGGAS